LADFTLTSGWWRRNLVAMKYELTIALTVGSFALYCYDQGYRIIPALILAAMLFEAFVQPYLRRVKRSPKLAIADGLAAAVAAVILVLVYFFFNDAYTLVAQMLEWLPPHVAAKLGGVGEIAEAVSAFVLLALSWALVGSVHEVIQRHIIDLDARDQSE